ncbi:MAG TPA: hypothetical protein VGB87_17185 [Vicinamibacteria bacterium]
MERRTVLVMAILGAALAAEALAQGAPAPPPFRLPPGARVRVFTAGNRPVEGRLAGQDLSGVTLAFPSEDPFQPPAAMAFPAGSIQRLEISLGRKRHTLVGALIGAVALGVTGFSDPVDTSGSCDLDSNQPCSRAEAVIIASLGGALLGGVVGHFVQSERWTPVALDAAFAAPPTARELRSAPGGPASPAPSDPPVRLSFRF